MDGLKEVEAEHLHLTLPVLLISLVGRQSS